MVDLVEGAGFEPASRLLPMVFKHNPSCPYHIHFSISFANIFMQVSLSVRLRRCNQSPT